MAKRYSQIWFDEKMEDAWDYTQHWVCYLLNALIRFVTLGKRGFD